MDSWCKKIPFRGKTISGGAARNVLLSRSGGMDKILEDVVSDALERALLAASCVKKAARFSFQSKRAG